jgi:hypothetical protein
MPLHYTAMQVQITAKTLTEKGNTTKPLLFTGKTLDKIWGKQSGPPQPPHIAELETRNGAACFVDLRRYNGTLGLGIGW